MGFRNALVACSIDGDKLSDSARLTLVAMAFVALDDDQGNRKARVYYGGWKLAMARLGQWPDEKSKRRFIRNVAELKKCGIVEVVSGAARGKHAVYRLRLPVENFAYFGDNFTESVDGDP